MVMLLHNNGAELASIENPPSTHDSLPKPSKEQQDSNTSDGDEHDEKEEGDDEDNNEEDEEEGDNDDEGDDNHVENHNGDPNAHRPTKRPRPTGGNSKDSAGSNNASGKKRKSSQTGSSTGEDDALPPQPMMSPYGMMPNSMMMGYPGMIPGPPGYPPMPPHGAHPYMPPMYPMPGFPGAPMGMFPPYAGGPPIKPPNQSETLEPSPDGGEGAEKDNTDSQTGNSRDEDNHGTANNADSGTNTENQTTANSASPTNHGSSNNAMYHPGPMNMMMPYPPPFGPGMYPMNPHYFMNPNAMANARLRPIPPQRMGITLSMACDIEHLSEYQILVRQQLELFEAAQEDVESNTQGRKKPVVLGQVGLRCRHCAPFALRARGRGAVYYPAKLYGIYQAAQNMAGSHLCQSCQHIPPLIKQELRKLRERRDNASGGKQYWADGCRALGLYEDDKCLRMRHAENGPSQQEESPKQEDPSPGEMLVKAED